MDINKRDQFIKLWREYFGDAELPVTFQYSVDNRGVKEAEIPDGHRCLIAQLLKVRRGESLCFNEESVTCTGGKRYLMFSDSMPKGFECYISHYNNGKGERYKRHPEQVLSFWENLPPLPVKGSKLIFKPWDKLQEQDQPDAVIFFANADVLSGLFTLVCFDSTAEDEVIAPFGAGCTNLVYYPLREQLNGTNRSVLGLMDPSARKRVKKDLVTFAIPFSKFMKIIDQMEESFLATETWETIRKRMSNQELGN
jgi:uncharacterized protein (DUF169 family)